MPRTVIETSAILSLDEDIKLNSDEVCFAALVKILYQANKQGLKENIKFDLALDKRLSNFACPFLYDLVIKRLV